MITGLRMNHAYIRPGGVAQDLPPGARREDPRVREDHAAARSTSTHDLLTGQPIWIDRLKDVGWLDVEGCLALGVTGPMLRAAGLPWDLRKTEPYCGYETYDFEVADPATSGDCCAPLPACASTRCASRSRSSSRPRPARARPGHGRRPEDRLAGAAVARRRRHGQLPRARPEDHGRRRWSR